MNFKNRTISEEINLLLSKSRGRLVVLTGARQVGKSTLAKNLLPNNDYINLDSPLEREVYNKMMPSEWLEQFPHATIDEIQKSPQMFDTIKACYDQDENCHFLLLGSSQVLLLKGVQETLAGRSAIRELFPFTIPEIIESEVPLKKSLLINYLSDPYPQNFLDEHLRKTDVLTPLFASANKAWEYFLLWGGMPSLLEKDWDDLDRYEWLQDYHKTYLQRDLLDLANLQHLEPFVRAQRVAALRTSETVNYSDLAKAADITAPTAKKFLQYLEVSYQVTTLPAWHRNKEKRLSKMPKLHFLDPGICRAIRRKQGDVNGHELESAFVAEVYKQVKNSRLPLELHHLRSSDGREVDLLIEREDGYFAFECKQTSKTSKKDARHLRGLQDILDKPLLGALVISNDRNVSIEGSESEKIGCCPFPLLFS